MPRITIDFGIDLGTTNSAIAVLDGDHVRVFRNVEGHEYTPSAVWESQSRELVVGRAAKERLESDKRNAFAEFKRHMGSNIRMKFERSGREMRPEDLSAEVLKYLREDVRRAIDEDVRAAVITVPADFDLPENGATRRAGELAGLSETPLVMEPVAAALAYSHRQPPQTNEHWLVFDFGGGTFDAALIRFRDGMFQVVNHAGDKLLGGKDIDKEIVDTLLVPVVLAKHDLPEFNRNNSKWDAAFGKLKAAAEKAKIALSSPGRTSESIEIEFLCTDVAGQPVRLDYQLKLAELERILEPFVDKAMNKCRECLAQKSFEAKHVAKLILVGGPTMTPYMRRRLSDAKTGLGIALEFSVDPMTVVAQGAALFARSQRRNAATEVRTLNAGEYAVKLDYKPTGADPEPMVGGRVSASGITNFSGYSISFSNNTPGSQWRGSRITLATDGGFTAVLSAVEFKNNTFTVELYDAQGTRLKCTPSSFEYLHGPEAGRPTLTHAVGVAMSNNEVDVFFDKGTPLKASASRLHRTTVELKAGDANSTLSIPVVEGSVVSRADRNRLVGRLTITGVNVRRLVPIGSDIEISLEIDESRQVVARAFVPLIDEEFKADLTLEHKVHAVELLRAAFELERKRLEQLRDEVRASDDVRAKEALTSIERERFVQDIERALVAAAGDPDSAQRCEQRTLDLRNALDRVEDAVEWPRLVAEASKLREVVRSVVDDPDYKAKPAQRSLVQVIERDLDAAIAAQDREVIRQRMGELRSALSDVLVGSHVFWIRRFQFLSGPEGKPKLTDQTKAAAFIQQGQRAINNNDIPSLQAAVRQLEELLPIGERPQTVGFDGGSQN